jgi:TPP-dependent 2-oxoacid decarboxylase
MTDYPDQITLSEYITARWKQLGVKHIFGCPGDFNLEVSPDDGVSSDADILQFLDYIEKDPALDWVGDGEHQYQETGLY